MRRHASVFETAVTDTGKGSDKDIRERVFDPFFTAKPAGAGLGLAISYRIVESHKGEIELRDRAGRGTEAIVRSPTTLTAEQE